METMNDTKDNVLKVLIIGSGPAGLSAALYAARANLEPLVVSGMELGGQVSITHIVENYPGFPDGISGPEMVEAFQKQAERFGAKIEFDSVTAVDLSQRPFRITTYGGEYLTEALIIATGATPRHLEIPGETEFTGRGVSYCATCDGHFFKEKEVYVVGGGDSALEEGLFLTRYANKVTVIHRRDELRAGAILQKRAFNNEKVDFVWDTVVTKISGNGVVNRVQLENKKTNEQREEDIDGVFIFIGHIPNTDLFEGQLEMDDRNYLVVDRYMHTNVPGVFAAGEVADPHFRQVVTSAGMGAAAAMEAVHFLDENSD
ncbi:MAG: thioredoxin-disulfide reductase [Anaerolineales bacterium]|jgi:thioredoxin reductase (NADPH)